MALWVTMAGGVDAVPLGVSLYSAMSRNPGLLMCLRRQILVSATLTPAAAALSQNSTSTTALALATLRRRAHIFSTSHTLLPTIGAMPIPSAFGHGGNKSSSKSVNLRFGA